jgi:hypothetical protein
MKTFLTFSTMSELSEDRNYSPTAEFREHYLGSIKTL